MEIVGLIFELLILSIGIYMYLFASGRIKSKDKELQAKAETFRQANKGWMRIVSLLLIAIMSIEIVLHVMAMV